MRYEHNPCRLLGWLSVYKLSLYTGDWKRYIRGIVVSEIDAFLLPLKEGNQRKIAIE
jgi:hypothetical protein